MSYQSIALPPFSKGLNLRDQASELGPGEAIDLLNVTFTERGAVRSRDGYAKLTTTALTNQPDSIFPHYTSAGDTRLIVGNGNRLDAINSFPGATATNSSALTNTASPHFFTRFGGPTTEAVYIANGADRIKRYVAGTGFTEPAGLSGIAPKFLAVQSPDNRLVAARFVGTTGVSNPSTVRFSEAGDPETFGANDYVQLDPGDGEAITGMAMWGNLLLVFKPSSIYSFFGNSVDATGEPEFNFRRVATGTGLIASQAITVGTDGVYFLDRKGVYRTRGQEPELVSSLLEPFFQGAPGIYFRSEVIAPSLISQCAMCMHKDRLFLSVPTGGGSTNDRLFEYDAQHGWWSLHDIPVSALCSFRPSASTTELVFAYADTSLGKHVGRHGSAYTADNMATGATGGTAITSRWRSGWLDLGTPDVKTIRETRVWGEGKCEFQLSRDFLDSGSQASLSFSSGASDTWGGGSGTDLWGDGTTSDLWGPTRQIIPRLVRQGRRGSVFSVTFSHSVLNESWGIHRADHHISGKRVPSVTRTEVAA